MSGLGSFTPKTRLVWRRLMSAAPPASPAAAAPAARAGPFAPLTARATMWRALPTTPEAFVSDFDEAAALWLAFARPPPDRDPLALPEREALGVDREAALVVFDLAAPPPLARLCPLRFLPLLDTLPPVLAMVAFLPRLSSFSATHGRAL
jgi:hypothetical protein